MDRRQFIQLGALAGGTLVASQAFAQGQSHAVPSAPVSARARTPSIVAPGGQVAVTTPNGSTLPWRKVGGVKVGHLVAMPVKHTFAPGLEVEAWGYNGSTPGPTIEAVEGDRLRIYVTNRLPEPTTVHWHGLIIPNGMDGVSGLNQRPIAPGETFAYEFTLNQPGTYMYHPHYDEMTQMALGMMGMFIVHPKRPRGPRVVRDFALMTHEWKVLPGMRRPDPNAMSDFNVLTFNSKAFPATEPLVIGRGERVRIRLGNLSAMDHHPIHLHGLSFEMTGTDGGFVPESARYPETSILVPVGSTRVIEFVADEPGDWAMHCHMTHHVMNQMGHAAPVTLGADARAIDRRVQALVPGYMTMGQDGMGGMEEMGMPMPANSIPMKGGKGPFGPIDMGGMFTLLKVRENPDTEDGSGWYVHPKGTVAEKADPVRMDADGINPDVRFG
ncbi:multicopper oxidase family protein [Myxococcus sp. AB056]|uniref:multicopper oxidase family protein n=1 Tax=Myxococcus sp. AB056 TaxID=2562792 RepID=UPI001146AB84|nr:copper oxidase [Myxococcus sp. AB056]